MTKKATIRQWLDAKGFDWDRRSIVLQPTESPDPGWDDPVSAILLAPGESHELLDREFDAGFGGPECPRFIARDGEAIYFPAQYDGATWCERVMLNLGYYLDPSHPTPYPGG